MKRNRFTDYFDDSVTVAKRLLGRHLVRCIDGQRLAGTIVEVEAYLGVEDAAAHTFNGRRTQRNESMYLGGGHAYVYMIYGIHFCLNVVCGQPGDGVAVLVRAIEPTEGIEQIRVNRMACSAAARPLRERDLCSGPGKLTQALQIDRSLDGESLLASQRLWIEEGSGLAVPKSAIGVSPRIGVEYAGQWAVKPLRFFIAGNPHISR